LLQALRVEACRDAHSAAVGQHQLDASGGGVEAGERDGYELRCLRGQQTEKLWDLRIKHRNSPDSDKEAVALDLARRHGRTQGRIAVLTCQETGLTYRVRKNAHGLIEPRKEPTRCVH
jgi:hypothetical protein